MVTIFPVVKLSKTVEKWLMLPQWDGFVTALQLIADDTRSSATDKMRMCRCTVLPRGKTA